MSSDPSLRRGPSAGESHVNIHGESFTDADLRNAGQDWGDSDPCLEQFLSTTGRRGVCRRERGHGGDHIDGDLAWTLAASPPAGDSRLITKEEDAGLPVSHSATADNQPPELASSALVQTPATKTADVLIRYLDGQFGLALRPEHCRAIREILEGSSDATR